MAKQVKQKEWTDGVVFAMSLLLWFLGECPQRNLFLGLVFFFLDFVQFLSLLIDLIYKLSLVEDSSASCFAQKKRERENKLPLLEQKYLYFQRH
jgi:hypothetical protein